ncbi:hypothetical protein A0H81_10930 [Grifola frondosa]|uniref:Uncharacterized protein n=1 Tax=Grifola frondosa TaxID=5627 RepID=A0A1C7LWQ0_GRIFR|nr:hypothetical protein A0H81_10930 [Grifola frondosa]
MAPPSWATPDELAWLQAHAEDYLTHQKLGTLPKFWSTLSEDWYKAFSEGDRLFGKDHGVLTDEQNVELGKAYKARTKASHRHLLRMAA